MKGVFVTGIGTDVGKTVVAAVLAKALNARYWKVVQCGSETDTNKIQELGIKTVKELILLEDPLSPHAAAKNAGIEIDLNLLEPLSDSEFTVVEGAGGLMVPITLNFTILDLIERFKLPVILVVRHYLGSINHTLLSLAAIKNANLDLAGIIISGNPNPDSEAAIINISKSKIIARVNELENFNLVNINIEADRLRESLNAQF